MKKKNVKRKRKNKQTKIMDKQIDRSQQESLQTGIRPLYKIAAEKFTYPPFSFEVIGDHLKKIIFRGTEY